MPEGRPAIIDRLRDATAVHHRAVEEAAAVLSGGVARYRWFVERQYGFHAALEPHLLAAPGLDALGLDLEARRRAHLFAADLLHLGGHPAAAARCEDLPRVDTAPRAMGALYVLEGATLGGIFILAHLTRAFGLRAGPGTSGVAPYGPALRARWAEFCAAAARCAGAAPGADEEMVHAAQETYAKILAWLRRAPPPAT